MGTYKVKCVNKDDSSEYNDCRCISEIGIPTNSGGTNKYTSLEIYNRIENDDDKFYVPKENGEEAWLETEIREGTKYVRTEPNDTPNDNLLQQDACPT